MKIIAITTVFLTLFFTNSAISKEKTIKFHKPETEAERALDEILRVENGLIKGSKLKREDMFTKGFIEDYERQEQIVQNSENCKKYSGMDCFAWGCSPIVCSQDSPYRYAEDPYGQLFRETNCKKLSNECYIKMTTGAYHMKKDNNMWKIDGTSCCGDSINYKIK